MKNRGRGEIFGLFFRDTNNAYYRVVGMIAMKPINDAV